MKVSELITVLQGVLEEDGDVNVLLGDMKAPTVKVEAPCFEEDTALYGERYLFIEESERR